VVGKDISKDDYDVVLEKITDWFSESRGTKSPAKDARASLQQCLDGTTKDGAPWFSASNATLEARVRMKCRFDMAAMAGIVTADEKKKRARQKDRSREKKKRDSERAEAQALMTDELTVEEKRRWQEIRKSYMEQFPELETVNAEAELNMLCDLHILQERQRTNMLVGTKVDPFERSQLAKDLQELKKALGIHPDQIAKRVKPKSEGTIGSAVARLESLGDWRALRDRFWIEELLQFYMMYMTPSADGSTYQLDDIGLYGMTRSRPAPCPKCGHVHLAGLDIAEIEAYLVERGVLRELDEKLDIPDAPSGEGPRLEQVVGGGETGSGDAGEASDSVPRIS